MQEQENKAVREEQWRHPRQLQHGLGAGARHGSCEQVKVLLAASGAPEHKVGTPALQCLGCRA